MVKQTASKVYPITINKVLLYRVHAFDVFHELNYAIFTRQGGVSKAPYHSLNLGSTVGDEAQAVEANYAQACRVLNINRHQTVSCYQVHSADILTINQKNHQPVMGQADGLITADSNIYLSLRFADCTPLLFFDPVRRAIGLTHAGWRGTIQNAAGATIRAMVNELGCEAQHIIAVIGPAIGPCCYEVGGEVIKAVTEHFTNPTDLLHDNGKTGHAYFDMWEANRRQLAAGGVKQVIVSSLCTACRTDHFFSHRAEQGKTGRFGVILGMKDTK
jgi:YfiH family protein